MSESDPQARRDAVRERNALGILASVSAVVLSIVSLGVAISANRTQERLLAASNWPMLEFSTGNRDDAGADVIYMALDNSGVGPARIRSFQLFYEGAPAADADALLRLCCQPQKGRRVTTITSSTRARVVRSGQDVQFLRLPRADNDDALWQLFNRRRFDVRAKACYCSVLDDCWLLDSTVPEPSPIDTCPVVPEAEQWSG